MPELADLEVTSVIRRQLRAGAIDAPRAGLALDDLAEAMRAILRA